MRLKNNSCRVFYRKFYANVKKCIKSLNKYNNGSETVSPNEGLYHFVVLTSSKSIKYCSNGLKKNLDTYKMI